MFQNYLITGLRNFTKHKLYSFINIAGLTVGLTCAIFITLFVSDQISYDNWIPSVENLYRVGTTIQPPGLRPFSTVHTPFVATQAMLDQIPEVLARTRLMRNPAAVLAGNHQFPEMIDSVDPNFFQVIRLPLTRGDPASVFSEPDTVVLSETTARKYFGGKPAVGRTVTIIATYCDQQGVCQLQRHPLIVTGILRDLPHNTQLAANLVMSNASKADPTSPDAKVNWMHTEGWGYVVLAPGSDPAQVVAKLRTIIDHAVAPPRGAHLKASQLISPFMTRFRDDHLSTDKYGGPTGSMTPPGSLTAVYGFAAIGVLILLVACFNFTNLSTARAMVRVREIGLRKAVGATRRQLIAQFLGESVLTALVALFLALAISESLLPLFDRLVDAPITFNYFQNWPVLLLLVGIAFAVGLVSGAYPALYLSGIRPGLVLRGNSAEHKGSSLLRTGLVVLQFAVSIGLGIAVVAIFAQVSFARHVDLGFRKDGVVLINGQVMSTEERKSFASALRGYSGIVAVAFSNVNAIPFKGNSNGETVTVSGGPPDLNMQLMETGPSYPEVYGVRLLAGRALSEQHATDTVTDIHVSMVSGATRISSPPYNILVNETGARMLGYSTTKALGKIIKIVGTPATIVGVVADMKMEGAKSVVAPTLYRYVPSWDTWISVRVRDEHLPQTLDFIDRAWRTFSPGIAIDRYFLNDEFGRQFQPEERQGSIFVVFVGVAVFIAALGLLGLAAFSADRRTREIGLRKAFGATTKDIILMLLWQFSIPVLVANLIAWPVAYYYLHGWLEGYAYRVVLSPFYFVSAGVVALMIAWATVIVHATHVARTSPVHALRYE